MQHAHAKLTYLLTPRLECRTNGCACTGKQTNTHALYRFIYGALGQALTGQIFCLQTLIALCPTCGTSENDTSDATGSNQKEEAVIFSIHR